MSWIGQVSWYEAIADARAPEGTRREFYAKQQVFEREGQAWAWARGVAGGMHAGAQDVESTVYERHERREPSRRDRAPVESGP